MSTRFSMLAPGESYMDRGAWWATVHRGHKELDTTGDWCTHTYLIFAIVLVLGAIVQ